MKKIDLTFGIPMYNAEKYIGELLDCFEESNVFSYEILIVNDGSKDSSLSICQRHSNPNIRIISKENGGVSSARNCIIDNANGKWITFVDADDLINFEEYEKSFRFIKENSDCDFCINIFKSNDYKIILSKNDYLPYLIEKRIINSPWCKFYLSSKLKNNNVCFNKEFSLGEDLLFNLSYYRCCSSIRIINDSKLYIYRVVNNNSLSLKYRNNKFEELMKVNFLSKLLFWNSNKRVLKALEYRRVGACFSCMKDIFAFSDKFDNPLLYVKNMKLFVKRQYFFMNNIKYTFIYNMWFILPSRVLLFLIKIMRSK